MDALRFTRLQDLIDQQALQGKRVFIRADLNVPQDDAGNITEDTRIRASVPAIQAALKAGAAVMVTSHLPLRSSPIASYFILLRVIFHQGHY